MDVTLLHEQTSGLQVQAASVCPLLQEYRTGPDVHIALRDYFDGMRFLWGQFRVPHPDVPVGKVFKSFYADVYGHAFGAPLSYQPSYEHQLGLAYILLENAMHIGVLKDRLGELYRRETVHFNHTLGLYSVQVEYHEFLLKLPLTDYQTQQVVFGANNASTFLKNSWNALRLQPLEFKRIAI